MYEEILNSAKNAITELFEQGHFKSGNIVVVGCSSSEIVGSKIGKGSTPEAAVAVVKGILPVIQDNGGLLAAQCCEHLNRALVVERATAEKFGFDIVNVRPRPKAGGSFATAVYESFSDPVVVEHVKATLGLDIGNTMIGMHMKDVAVPLRLNTKKIGEANVNAAYSRARLIGGCRAEYVD